MLTELDVLLGSCSFEIEQCNNVKKLEDVRTAIFGKNGKLTAKIKALKNASEDDKKLIGAKINEVKKVISDQLSTKLAELEMHELETKLKEEYVDVTLPVEVKSSGFVHPITKVFAEIANILSGYGFEFAEGPDIESEHFNFDVLNMPSHHPARTMHDTFYLNVLADDFGRKLLRTHTSPVENRVMIKKKPPLRMFTMGRVFRSDYDATHTPMFNQVEMLVVDKDIGFAQLKWLIADVLKKFFEVNELSVRFRPSFFPFTEPSAEADINYSIVNGKMKFGVGNKWLEIGGCGVSHPNVLKDGGVDPNEYQGIAFGLGIERLASLKYGVPDLRGYFESDERWREAFGFSPEDL
ncbi:MAG: phenylalanine--tRNA ligase subunit alpha [Alphaproteobacteria bacterium]|nr:phenylalanine--tRNA ligase subunit alpha [Alphaproteobacteria bacterium]